MSVEPQTHAAYLRDDVASSPGCCAGPISSELVKRRLGTWRNGESPLGLDLVFDLDCYFTYRAKNIRQERLGSIVQAPPPPIGGACRACFRVPGDLYVRIGDRSML